MKRHTTLMLGLAAALSLGAQEASQTQELLLCDGETTIEIPAGENFDRPTAQTFADRLMDLWFEKNPTREWIMAAAPVPAPQPQPTPQKAASSSQPEKQSEIYNRYTDRDYFVWENEFQKFVAEGDRVFHDAEAFGGTVGVSCDMCHPNAANTHPETYPKYQVQLQRVALLRDMVNWCIQHASKGKALADDDPRLRAMEAYIMAQRKGKVMEPNKH